MIPPRRAREQQTTKTPRPMDETGPPTRQNQASRRQKKIAKHTPTKRSETWETHTTKTRTIKHQQATSRNPNEQWNHRSGPKTKQRTAANSPNGDHPAARYAQQKSATARDEPEAKKSLTTGARHQRHANEIASHERKSARHNLPTPRRKSKEAPKRRKPTRNKTTMKSARKPRAQAPAIGRGALQTAQEQHLNGDTAQTAKKKSKNCGKIIKNGR